MVRFAKISVSTCVNLLLLRFLWGLRWAGEPLRILATVQWSTTRKRWRRIYGRQSHDPAPTSFLRYQFLFDQVVQKKQNACIRPIKTYSCVNLVNLVNSLASSSVSLLLRRCLKLRKCIDGFSDDESQPRFNLGSNVVR